MFIDIYWVGRIYDVNFCLCGNNYVGCVVCHLKGNDMCVTIGRSVCFFQCRRLFYRYQTKITSKPDLKC